MFYYNRFWHFWFTLNNFHYSKIAFVSAIASSLFLAASLFFAPLINVALILPLATAGIIVLFTQLSNFFYRLQNYQLNKIKSKASNTDLAQQIDLYLNRRAICPKELLKGSGLNLPAQNSKKSKQSINKLLLLETDDPLTVKKIGNNTSLQNVKFLIKSKSANLLLKEAPAAEVLAHLASKEMAEVIGLGDLIAPTNIADPNLMPNASKLIHDPSQLGAPSKKQIQDFLIEENKTRDPINKIKNTVRIQNAIRKVVSYLKTLVAQAKVKKGMQFNLMHMRKFIPENQVLNASYLFREIFNQPIVSSGLTVDLGIASQSKLEREEGRKKIKQALQAINIDSFQKNFLLHVLLGSQDARVEKTLFTVEKNQLIVNSAEFQQIMPEDNYNVSKKVNVEKGIHPGNTTVKMANNVFPFHLWMAGIPQAEVPFQRKTIQNLLNSLDPTSLLAYHQRKKLFSPAAVGAQLDRVLLIRKLFEEEVKKNVITLTPKALFLKFVNNHPTYLFLKNEVKLNDFHVFNLLGQVPEGADMSLLRHPLQWIPMQFKRAEAHRNIEKIQLNSLSYDQKRHLPSFSEESLKSSHAQHFQFFKTSYCKKDIERGNQAGLNILDEVSSQLKVSIKKS